MADEKLKCEGRTFTLGGRELIIPSLSVKQTKKNWSAIRDFGKAPKPDITPEDLDAWVLANYEKSMPIVTMAIQRNYPDMTQDEVEDLVDLSNYHAVVAAVLGQSKLLREPGAAGGAQPAA